MNYKLFVDHVIFTRTVEIQLSNNFTYSENNLYNILKPDSKIVKIKSNYGESSNPDFIPYKKIKSNRGRPALIKTNTSQMYTQTTLYILNENYGDLNKEPDLNKCYKIYKPKLFRNGKIQISGIVRDDLSDMHYIINIICDKLKDLNVFNVSMQSYKIVMANIKLYFNESYYGKYLIDLEKLLNALIEYKKKDNTDIIIINSPIYTEERNAFISIHVKISNTTINLNSYGASEIIPYCDFILKIKIYKTGNINASTRKASIDPNSNECICIRWLEDIILESNSIYEIEPNNINQKIETLEDALNHIKYLTYVIKNLNILCQRI
jgi:hypothetical protein